MGEPYVESNSTLIFFVNGKKVIDDDVDPEWTLLYYLRNKLRLCGTKLGCAEGGCGACTVMVSKYNPTKKKIIHYSVNACLAPVCSMHGLAVTTVEGIGSTQTLLHPVQQRIALAHGSQCGFCTPGIVMSMYTLLRSLPASERPSMKDIEVAFQGNLCRCTGYRPIIEGFRTFTEEWEKAQRMSGLSNGVCGLGDQCCKNKKNVSSSVKVNGYEENGYANGYENGTDTSDDVNRPAALFDPREFLPYDPSQEPIFPPELQLSRKLDNQNIVVKGPRATWYRPVSLEKLLNLKKRFPQSKIVNGNTEVGVEVKFKNFVYPVIIHPNQISELTEVVDTDNGVIVGAAVTLSDLQAELEKRISNLPDFKTKIFQEITKMLHWFAGKQIRNVGVVGGNIMTGSPISDLNPIFMASNCRLHLQSEDHGKRIVTMDENFWTGYRRNIVKPDEVLTHIEIPHTQKNHFFRAYKQSKRREDDIAIVNAAFNLILDDDHRKVVSLIMSYGGMAPTTVIATQTGQLASGKKWNKDLLENIYQSLVKELPLDPGAPGGMIRYRQSLTLSLFFKFFVEVSNSKSRIILPDNEKLGPFNGTEVSDYFTAPENVSAKDSFSTAEPKSSQYYQMVPESQEKTDLIGRPVVHQSAFKQATGEAKYCDDIPRQEGELYMALVTSTRPNAHIINIDSSKALAEKGVHAFFCSKDIDEPLNYFGHIIPDEMVFAHRKVTSIGQIIGAVVADNQLIAQRAAKLVKVEYEDIQPVIITIEDAIREKSYFFEPKKIVKGNLEAAFAKAEHILDGEIRMGGQEHFYLETQACLVIPKYEDNELEVISSTQHPTDLQMVIARMLDIPGNRIVVKVKRMGGGFGGKETRSIMVALPCSLAAHKLRRPIRCMLDRDEDILITGQRHPFLGRYKVAFESSGKITGIEMKLYNNGGNTLDMSTPMRFEDGLFDIDAGQIHQFRTDHVRNTSAEKVMERAMFHMESCYYIPNVVCYGYTCRTNTVSNTAFRGFGGPQGMFVGETMIRQVADYLKMDLLKVMEMNLYKEGQSTHFNQKLVYCTLERCWRDCIRDSRLHARQKEVEEFNRKNRWRKRGIAIVPTKFGISFTTLFLNQAGALVLIYMDGSVLISHGGTEMGQGLHTKMLQVASRALGVSVDLIHISETSTDKVPNTSATAASSGSDLNGMAILNACEILNERLKPYKEANPKGSWKDWINKAFHDRVCLSAAGFYKTPDIGYNYEKNAGMAFNYFTYGAACSEVEIDCLTGDHQVRRTDIVMDLGESINPAIDIGQIEGAFMQGYGLYTIEEMIYSPSGLPYTRGPGAYKIPGFADIPAEFNVSLLKGAPNPRAVYSSKAVGEPPLFLASSVYFAIYEAVKAARNERGIKGYFRFDSPATCARIRMACWDEITEKIPEPAEGSFKPWNVVI